jgi:hypothetical protein
MLGMFCDDGAEILSLSQKKSFALRILLITYHIGMRPFFRYTLFISWEYSGNMVPQILYVASIFVAKIVTTGNGHFKDPALRTF